MLRLSFEKMIVAEIRTIRLYCYQSNCGEIIRKYFNNSAKEDGLGWWWTWELWAAQDKLCLQYILPTLYTLRFWLPWTGQRDTQYSTLTVQNQWDSQWEGTSNLSNLIPTHKATAVSCHLHPHKGSVSLCWTTCRDKKLTSCKDAKSLWGALL